MKIFRTVVNCSHQRYLIDAAHSEGEVDWLWVYKVSDEGLVFKGFLYKPSEIPELAEKIESFISEIPDDEIE